MELYAYRENGEFIGTIDFYTSLRWRRQYWTAGEVELHLPATKENLAAIQAGVILRRVGRTESARIMGIKTKGGEITANARMLEIYFSMEQFLEGSFPALVDGRGGAERCLDCRVVGAG